MTAGAALFPLGINPAAGWIYAAIELPPSAKKTVSAKPQGSRRIIGQAAPRTRAAVISVSIWLSDDSARSGTFSFIA